MTESEFESAVAKIRAGDRNGLREIYDAYGDKIYRIFLGKVHHHQDAEDLTSEFFLKLWECAASHRPGQGHRCWLTTIARNMAIDYLRRSSRETPVEDAEEAGLAPDTTTPETEVLGQMQASDLLASLSEDEQEIIRLHIAAELTFREIADILKKPLGTVAWKYRNAIGKLQKLAKEGRLV